MGFSIYSLVAGSQFTDTSKQKNRKVYRDVFKTKVRSENVTERISMSSVGQLLFFSALFFYDIRKRDVYKTFFYRFHVKNVLLYPYTSYKTAKIVYFTA